MKIDPEEAVRRLVRAGELWVSNRSSERLIHHATAQKLCELGWAVIDWPLANRGRVTPTPEGRMAAK